MAHPWVQCLFWGVFFATLVTKKIQFESAEIAMLK